MLVTQPSLTLCGPVDCGSPGSAVRGVLQTGPWRGQPLHRPGPEEALAPRHLSVCLSSARVCCMWLFTLYGVYFGLCLSVSYRESTSHFNVSTTY